MIDPFRLGSESCWISAIRAEASRVRGGLA
jgi:hypothetical protein